MSCLSADFGSRGFGWISKMFGLMRPYYVWYKDGSHMKHVNRKTTGLLKTGPLLCLYIKHLS